jgi:hypothetical protein
VRGGAVPRNGQTEVGSLVPLPELSQAQRSTSVGFRRLYPRRNHNEPGSDYQVFVVPWCAARVLLALRVNPYMRE